MAPTILHVEQPVGAGVPTVVRHLMTDQLLRGWTVAVASPADGELAAHARAGGALWHDWTAARSPGPGTVGEARALAALLGRVRADLVHLHSSKAGLAGRVVLRGRLPTVFQPHAWGFEAANPVVGGAALQWERHAVRWADMVVCVSEAERLRAVRAGVRARWAVVPNGVDLEYHVPAGEPERDAARVALGIPPQAPLALVIGRLARQKGQDLALQAWPRVAERVPGARLAVVGDGPDRRRLAARAGAGVLLTGAQADVRPWLAAADLVIAPSRYEAGLSLAIMEAMASARSVVAADVAGVRDGLAADAGAIVPVDAVELLAEAVAVRLADRALTAAEGLAGRRRIEERYGLGAASAAMAGVYERVLRARGRWWDER